MSSLPLLGCSASRGVRLDSRRGAPRVFWILDALDADHHGAGVFGKIVMRATFAILCYFLLTVLGACSSAPPFDAKAVAQEWAAYMQRDYTLRPGDKLGVQVIRVGEDTPDNAVVQQAIVSPTGTVDLLRLPKPIHVSGRSVAGSRSLILDAYEKVFANPRVSVTLVEASAQSVYVCGEVNRPGPIPYQPGLTMTQAIASSGSYRNTVDGGDIRILRIALDGTQRSFRVNLDSVLYDSQPDFLLLPGDVVFCQPSTIAEVGDAVDLYIRRLLPFTITGPSIGVIGQ